MKRKSALFALLLAVPSLYAQEEAPKEDPNVRPAGEVVLKFEHKIKVPEVKRFGEDGVLEIFPGDIVNLEFKAVNGKLVAPKVVPEVKHPERTISFNFTQDESITMLLRETGIQETVALDCTHVDLRSNKSHPTNLRPTEKGLMVADSWPNTVWMLRLSNIEVTSRPASEVYKEKVAQSQKPEPAAPPQQ